MFWTSALPQIGGLQVCSSIPSRLSFHIGDCFLCCKDPPTASTVKDTPKATGRVKFAAMLNSKPPPSQNAARFLRPSAPLLGVYPTDVLKAVTYGERPGVGRKG